MCFYISLDIFKIILTLMVIYYSTVWIHYYIRNHTDIKLFGLFRIILYYKYYHSGHLSTCYLCATAFAHLERLHIKSQTI